MSAKVYHLPNFFALLPSKPGGDVCPHFKEAEISFNSWVKEKFGDTRMAIEFQRSGVVLLAALSYPTASLQQLKGIVDLMKVFLFLEILTRPMCSGDDASSAASKASVQSWIKILLAESITLEEEKSIHPYLQIMLYELVPNLRALVGPFHWHRFAESNKAYAMGVVQEALDRESYMRGQMRDVQSYVTMRRELVGARACFTLTQGLYMPDDVLDHPAICEMENAANDMIWIVKDVYSFKQKFRENGRSNNLLVAMQRDPKFDDLNLQERVGYAEKLFKEALERFNTSRGSSLLLEQETEQQVAAYADGLINWVVGNLQWSAATRRYDVFMNEENREHRILKMKMSPFASL